MAGWKPTEWETSLLQWSVPTTLWKSLASQTQCRHNIPKAIAAGLGKRIPGSQLLRYYWPQPCYGGSRNIHLACPTTGGSCYVFSWAPPTMLCISFVWHKCLRSHSSRLFVSAAVVVLIVFIATGRSGRDGHIAEPSKKPQKNLKVTTNVD